MNVRIGTYLRQQHLALLTLLLVMTGGTAVAVGSVHKNSVTSQSIRNETVKGQDVKNGSLKGADIDEASLDLGDLPGNLPPSGPAGGSLAGKYPNPTLAANSVGSSQIDDFSVKSADLADNDVTGADVNEATLGQVPSALSAVQGGLGRYGFEGSCDPESDAYVACSFVPVTVSTPARLLVIATVSGSTEGDSDNASGICRLRIDANPVVTSAQEILTHDHSTGYHRDNTTMTAVTDVLPVGTHAAAVDCNQLGFGAIMYPEARIVVVALSAG